MTKDSRRAGFYWVEDKPYASVTSILKVIDKSEALLGWAARETYYAMVKDPTISEDKAVRAHLETRDEAASRGSTIHSLLEVYRASGEVVSTLPIYRGYYTAFKSWVEKNQPRFIKQEETLVDHELKIAGTYDGLAEINGKIYLIDFKTNKEGRLFPEVELQLSAYLHMARKTQKIDGILAVGLAEDGRFNELYCIDRFDAFLHCFELYKWKEKDKLEKVGYGK
jgi:ATP-dependent exoDNAse (exonuclease V) beta subunit